MGQVSDATWYRLSGSGHANEISCSQSGAFVGSVPLLARDTGLGSGNWKPRSIAELNTALTVAYGLPVDLAQKANGFAVVARSLNTGNLALAQIAMLHLHLPALPTLAKGEEQREQTVALAALLHRTGILKFNSDLRETLCDLAKRDVSSEPRIPRGQHGAGRWTTSANSSEGSPIVPTQAIPFEPLIPFDLRPLVRPTIRPLPPTLDNPPIELPNGVTRDGIPQKTGPNVRTNGRKRLSSAGV
ncbi:MAG TPA: hypothetical protein VET85_13915 [Stellaceae bacterium]|nr:hypothetical protein [Stellaceae bacterium]